MTRPDYIVEINALGRPEVSPQHAPPLQGRPWLAVRWQCCCTYSRIYRNPAGTAYHGRCPRCAKPIHIRIAADGTANRFFEAY